jgi:hypothetical protein
MPFRSFHSNNVSSASAALKPRRRNSEASRIARLLRQPDSMWLYRSAAEPDKEIRREPAPPDAETIAESGMAGAG